MQRNVNYTQCLPGGMESDDDDDDFYDDEEPHYTPVHQSMVNGESSRGTASNTSSEMQMMNDSGSNSVRHEPEASNTRKVVYDESPLVDDLRLAVMHGNLATVESLIVVQQAVTVDAIMRPGWTALMYACSFGNPEVTRFLLDNGADSNYHHDGFTPLMAACSSSKNSEDKLLKCVESLLKHSANVNAAERYCVTPLMYAAREGHQKIIEVLLKSGSEVNAMDNRGWTSLQWAISRGNIATVRELLRAEASVAVSDNRGQSIAEFANEQGRDKISQLLKEYESTKRILEDAELHRDPVAEDSADASIDPKPKFSMIVYGDLEMFLSGLGLSDLIPVFHSHALKFEDVLQMTDESLQKIGIDKYGWRKSIVDGIRTVHRKEWQESSLPNLREKKAISCPDVICMMSNIGKHLSYIRETVAYLRMQLRVDQRILESGQEYEGVRSVLKNTLAAVDANQQLTGELRRLRSHLDNVKSNCEYQPADLIASRTAPASAAKSRTYVAVFGIAAVALVASFMAYRKPLSARF